MSRPIPLVRAREVSVTLGGRRVLDRVDLAIHRGEVVALLGPNGAGKSTLVSVLAGDIAPGHGGVELHGRPLRQWRPLDQARRRAVLPQQHTLSFPFRVDEVVRMGRAPWTGTADDRDDDRIVAEALAAVDATHLADRSFSALSGGERARVALARVLAQCCPLLLLDEPTAALDLHHQELVLRLARERAAAGDGVAVVLHDLALAAAYADRTVILADGRVVADGPPAEVFTSDLLSRTWRHPIEVFPHPRTGALLVLPVRSEPVAQKGS